MSDLDISPHIVAKSDQLNADDLVGGPITVRIERVSRGDSDQPVAVHLSGGHQPWKPCKTMLRVMASAWGTRTGVWVGRSVRLFRDPSVLWAGKEVGGIRIEALSHIEGPLRLNLAESKRSKKWQEIGRLTPQDAEQDTQQPDPAWAAFVAALEAEGYPVDLVDRWHRNEAPNPCPLREIAPANLGGLLAYLQSTEGAATLDEFDTRTTEQNQ